MANVLLLEIGDEVVVNENKKGEVFGFYEIVLSKGSCFEIKNYNPGIYRDPMLVRIRIENNEIADVYYNCLEMTNPREYDKRAKTTGYYKKRFIRELPETLFCERDKVQIKPESLEKICDLLKEVIEGHRHRKPQMLRAGVDIGKEPDFNLDTFFISSINYQFGDLNANGSYVCNISNSPDNFHWHITVKESDLKLLKHGEIWKVYYEK